MNEHHEHDQGAVPVRDWGPRAALRTRRARFLYEADRLFPWERWVTMIEPIYPKRGNGRPPYSLGLMLRLYMLQQWFNLSDLAAQELGMDSVAVRNFIGLGMTWDKGCPDESTIASFRRLLGRRGLAAELASEANEEISKQGWKLRTGELSEASILAIAV